MSAHKEIPVDLRDWYSGYNQMAMNRVYGREPERPIDPPEPVLTLEGAKRLLRDEYVPLQLASALNEGSGTLHPRINTAAKIGDWVEVGNLMRELYDQHIEAGAQEMVDKQ